MSTGKRGGWAGDGAAGSAAGGGAVCGGEHHAAGSATLEGAGASCVGGGASRAGGGWEHHAGGGVTPGSGGSATPEGEGASRRMGAGGASRPGSLCRRSPSIPRCLYQNFPRSPSLAGGFLPGAVCNPQDVFHNCTLDAGAKAANRRVTQEET